MKYTFLILTLLLGRLTAECLNCIKPESQRQSNGQVVEWITKKCMAIQDDITGKQCPGCKCSRASHTIHRDPYMYHKGKRLTAKKLGTVDVGDIFPNKRRS